MNFCEDNAFSVYEYFRLDVTDSAVAIALKLNL